MAEPSAEQLCLSCGLCCDGTIFVDVKLSAVERLQLAQALGVNAPPGAVVKNGASRLRQPCPAFQNNRCTIYSERPAHCRNFDCAMLQRMLSGQIDAQKASATVRLARRKAEQVRRLLRQAGDTEEHLDLMTRYRRLVKKCQNGGCDAGVRRTMADLSLAIHDLTFILAKHFYP